MDRLTTKIVILLLGIQYLGRHWQLSQSGVLGNFRITRYPRVFQKQKGDIYIGVLAAMSSPCSVRKLRSSASSYEKFATIPEMIEYAVRLVNKRNMLPNNLTLGFIILDVCESPSLAAIQALSFLKQMKCPGNVEGNAKENYQVVAVVDTGSSPQAMLVARILGAARIPQVSTYATSDELSDKRQYPYFMRVVAPDSYQLRAVLEVMKINRWNYISLVYSDDSYGENIFRQIKNIFIPDICLAAVSKVRSGNLTQEDIDNIAGKLLNIGSKATVVVISLSFHATQSILVALKKMKMSEPFIWVFINMWTPFTLHMVGLEDEVADSLRISQMPAPVPVFYDWLRNMKSNSTGNPWFRKRWEVKFKCSFDNGSCDTITPIYKLISTNHVSAITGYIMDAVVMIANATSRVLKDPKCYKGAQPKECVSGPKLLQELRATRNRGFSGWQQLDSNGNPSAKYVLEQVRVLSGKLYTHTIRLIDNKTIENVGQYMWPHHTLRLNFVHPLSVCSFPCKPHFAYVERNVSCCWVCRRCDINERLVNNKTKCQKCPEFTWPDPLTQFTTCIRILNEETDAFSATNFTQDLLGVLCLCVCLSVFIFFQYYSMIPILNNCCRGVSFMTLIAIAIGYVVIIFFTLAPSETLCRITFFLFSMSYTLMYCPIFLQAVQKFFAFRESDRFPPWIQITESRHQYVVASIVVFMQVVLISGAILGAGKWSIMSQRYSSRPIVEHCCQIPSQFLAIIALVSNILLVVTSAVLTFVNSHYQSIDSFKEPYFLSMTMYTTLIMAVCFLPAYYVADYHVFRNFIMVLAIVFNHTTALICIYLSKIYILVWDNYIMFGKPPLLTETSM